MANPSGDLRPGAYATVRLEVERKPDALLVPVQALVVEKAGTFLFTVADNKAKKTPVHVGLQRRRERRGHRCQARPTGDPRRQTNAHRRPAGQRSGGEMRRGILRFTIYDLRGAGLLARASLGFCVCVRRNAGTQLWSCAADQRRIRLTCRPRCGWRGRRISIFKSRASGWAKPKPTARARVEQFFPWMTAGRRVSPPRRRRPSRPGRNHLGCPLPIL